MERESIALLGIPVDNLTMNEALNTIFHMTESYAVDKIPKYVATVNVDFIVNTLSWRAGRSRHPELLDILRHADLVTPDGMPVIWASRLMDSPLRERVSGSDMVPEIAQRASKTGKSLFLFGGESGTAEKAAKKLLSKYPGLRIVGTHSPEVATVGEEILDSSEKDREIVKKINDSKADILMIALGNPKQEIWFARNRNALKIPVSIGIGGTFGFITGEVARAPVWMQRNGLEWVYRIIQDPGRLWKRYFTGLLKLCTNIIHPIIIHKLLKTTISCKSILRKIHNCPAPELEIRKDLAILTMPELMTRESLSIIKTRLKYLNEYRLLFDFKDTIYMDLYAMGFITGICRDFSRMKKSFYLTGIRARIIGLLKYNRIWDICEKRYIDNPELIPIQINSNDESSFYFTTVSDPGAFRMELHGRLDAANISKLDIPKITEFIGNKNCIMNLKNLRFIDSTGLIFFLKIKKHLSAYNRTPIMCNVNEDVMQIFNITKLINLFKIMPDFYVDKPLI